MIRFKFLAVVVGAAAAATLGFAGLGLARTGANAPSVSGVVHHTRTHTPGAVGSPHLAPKSAAVTPATKTDPAEGVDTPGTEVGGQNTGAGENDTHADPPAQDVNHECPPNCDTAHGEQP